MKTANKIQIPHGVELVIDVSFDIDEHEQQQVTTSLEAIVDGKTHQLDTYFNGDSIVDVFDGDGPTTTGPQSQLCELVGDDDQLLLETFSFHLEKHVRLAIASACGGPVDWDFDWDHNLHGNNYLPIAQLTNGVKVANFCSPHTFEFEDGTILGKRSQEWAERVKADIEEQVVEERHGINLIAMSIKISGAALLDLKNMTIQGHDEFDLLILPLMMCQGLAKVEPSMLRTWLGEGCEELMSKVVSIPRRGRGGPICIDKFCVQ